jgi:hypothetical protein
MFGLAILIAAAMATDAVATLEITGETNCPTPDAVRSQLQPLTPRPWPRDAAVTSVVLARDKDRGTDRDSLVVMLFDASHQLLEERRLALYPGCDERARAVAVVVASWLTALPAASPAMVRLPPMPEASPTVVRGTPPAGSRPGFAVTGAAAALASVVAGGLAPGVMIEAAIAPPDQQWSVSLAGLLEGTHRMSIGDGQATWWRWGGAVGGGWRPVRGRIWLELRAAFLLTRLHIAGAGFTNDTGATTWDPGGTVATRLGYAWPRVRPWLGAWAVGWGGTQNVHLVGDATRGQIPRFQALFGVGATFGTRSATF